MDTNQGTLKIGTDPAGQGVYLTEKMLATHSLVLAKRDAGGLTATYAFLDRFLTSGWSGLVLDMAEESSGLMFHSSALADARSMSFQRLALSDKDPWLWLNPMEGISADEAYDLSSQLRDLDDPRAHVFLTQGMTSRPALDVSTPGLTYIGLDAASHPELSDLISALMLQRLRVLASDRSQDPGLMDLAPRFLLVNGASRVNLPLLSNLVARARAARMVVLLVADSLEDLNQNDLEVWASITQNVNVVAAGALPGAASLKTAATLFRHGSDGFDELHAETSLAALPDGHVSLRVENPEILVPDLALLTR